MQRFEALQKPTAIITGSIYLEHETGRHPESVGRLARFPQIIAELLAEETGHFTSLEPQEAPLTQIARVHDASYLEDLRDFCESGGGRIDPDTHVSEGSYRAARYAVGGLLRGIEAVLVGEVQNAFALVRPPGHHALTNRSMGFCLFNNVALAARHLIEEYGLHRILIVDWDVHHGNGTQNIFYDDPRVLYYSSHQSPLYPGTGSLDEIGVGQGCGYNVNLPLPPGSGDTVMEQAFTRILEPLAERYEPEFILVSAGYDAHWRDALHTTALQVSTLGFATMVDRVKRLAETFCQGRLALTLEGGYDPAALADSVYATLRVLAGESPEKAASHDLRRSRRELPANHEYILALLEEIRKTHSL
ncbi:MAG: histone deacetylase [Chloroflexota bacterium]